MTNDVTQNEAELIRRVFELDPILGTQLGIAGDHDGRLPPADGATQDELIAGLFAAGTSSEEALLDRNVDDQIDQELAASGVRRMQVFHTSLRAYERNPNWYLEAAMSGLHSLLMRSDMPTHEKADRIGQRLAAIPGLFAAGKEQIMRPPSVLLETAVGDIPGAIEFCGDSLTEFVDTVPDPAAQRSLRHGQQACLASLADFGDFLDQQAPLAVDDFAIGRDAFDQLLATSLVPHDSDTLYEMGEQLADGLARKLEEISLRTANRPEWWTTLEALSLNHPARGSLFADYARMVKNAREFLAEQELVDLAPVGDLAVIETPTFARTNLPFAAYIPAPPFAASGSGQFWVTPIAAELDSDQAEQALRRQHLGRVLIASVHEGYPGHHVQFSHALRVQRPLRHIFSSTVFFEGWGLYSEELMLREGFMRNDPAFELLHMSQIRDQLWRAIRIVLDVGLHCRGMSQAEATDLLVDQHILSRESAAAEVMYYCSAPTQPMSYMVGKLLIDELIRDCRASGEERFRTLPQIHNEILAHGSLPVPLLRRAMRIV